MNLMKCYEPFLGVGRKYLFCKEIGLFWAKNLLQNKFKRAKKGIRGSLSFIRFIKLGSSGRSGAAPLQNKEIYEPYEEL